MSSTASSPCWCLQRSCTWATSRAARLNSSRIPLKLEGLVAKRADSAYRPGVRSSDWAKVKRKGAIPPERFKR
ncbi:hypothetical protein [Variovorax sp. VRV01]|uniref:ATP-dependent DNA ligase n=1 Tax=Variovorax sp. VRV01 TaxID=2769259 RepID=UPI001CE1B62A|nr:hypothetical protein [Variovorax sp. VRV01]